MWRARHERNDLHGREILALDRALSAPDIWLDFDGGSVKVEANTVPMTGVVMRFVPVDSKHPSGVRTILADHVG